MSDNVEKVRWGVLGVAAIAVKKVIPAMQRGTWSTVTAIASRDRKKAEEAARTLGIPKAYGSYEELLADGDVEAIYNPLPNHLHISWSVKCARAGKHVLCEKPLSLNAAEARELLAARDSAHVKGSVKRLWSAPTRSGFARANWCVPEPLGSCDRSPDFSATSIAIRRTSETLQNLEAAD
jgi:hypothetical protein